MYICAASWRKTAMSWRGCVLTNGLQIKFKIIISPNGALLQHPFPAEGCSELGVP